MPNHGFKTGERLTFTKSTLAGVDSLIVGNDSSNQGTFFIPDTNTLSSDVFVINKGENLIGLTTQVGLTTASEGLFFYSDGSNNSEYLLKTNRNQILGNVDRITTIVSTSSTHGLLNRDVIKLNVVPNTVVGFGTTGALNIKLNEDEKKILVNTIGINSTGISLSDGSFTYQDHGYKTGDKVFYEATEVASGLTTGTYYIIQDSVDRFRLAETLFESNAKTENAVSISASGGVNHYISAINPPIDVVRNSDLKFNLQDISLRGYQLKIYRDKDFTNEYISSGDSRDFNVVGLGSVGFGTDSNSSLTVNYSNNIPSRLYYGLEKGGYISTADTEVKSYSEIRYENSEYNGTYSVFGISTTSSTTEFKISPFRYPTILSYSSDDCDTLEYNTRSSNALNGSISKVKVIAEGFNFDKLPKFKDVTSTNGVNANIVAVSTSIGRIKKSRIRDIGYDYPSDKTLRPEAFVPPIVSVDNLDTIQEVDIQFAGAKYLSDPDLILWNDTTKKIVDTTTLVAKAPNGSIAEVVQLAPIFGLDSEPHKIFAINNSNGVGIVSMVSGPTGIATCVLKTPILGYNQSPFAVDDRVFVEGIEMSSPDGSGFNSSDYNYQLFKVTQFANTSPATLTFQLVDDAGVGLTTNAGIAKTYQSGYASLINENIYPRISIKQKRGTFTKNERLFVNSDGNGFRSEDAFISLVRDDYIKYNGRYNLKKGDIIKGIISGVVAEVTNVNRKRAKFVVDYSSRMELGWNDDIGKISEDYQVTPNNDYYQNLSYSIKSPITWDELSTPVNSIVHPAGLKNFADVGVTSIGRSGIGLGGTTTSIVILDVVNERRVDIINNFDNAVDVDPRVSPVTGLTQSNALQIQNRKLTDYIECRTNRVLIHDDISNKFSSRGFKDTFVEIEEIDFVDNHVRYVVQIADPDSKDVQLSELVVQSTTNDIFLFEKYSSFTKNKLGDFTANIDSFGRKTLVFTPTDAFETDHDIKVLKKSYLFQALPPGNSGVGTQAIGSVNLISSFVGLSSVPGGNDIGTLAQFDGNDFNGLFANIEISNRFSGETNYVEAAIDFDGTNTYVSEYYFDHNTQSYSASNVGLVSAIYDANSGIVSVRGRNFDEVDAFDYRTHIVGFGNTTTGIGTYRFLLNNQPAGTERSARLESTIGFGTDKVRVGTFDNKFISAAAAIVRVSAGTTSAIHQVNILSNSRTNEVTVTPGPFAPVDNVTGLGTFGSEINGDEFYLNFYPDSGYDVEAQAFSEVFYREMDFDNQANPLSYGPTSQLVFLSAFDGLNGLRANRTNFTLTHEGKPIYVKTFDPADTTKINYSTGVFTLRDHFFNTGEELIYRPTSTFAGIGTQPMGIGATVNHLGIVTDKLPDRVYPIAITPDTFRLSTTPQFAAAGISVTFTDSGIGNAHQLEFTKKLSKTVIAIDGIVQQPITFTPINHKLDFNGHYLSGGIPAGISTFNITGISSIQPRDLLRVDDEYMKVIEVGLSTNVSGEILGPINGLIAAGLAATFPTVAVQRGSVGSAATSHSDGSTVQIYRGALNIVGNEVHFIDPPKGNNRARRNESNLPYVTAQFSGRTFLRSDYDTNMVFDDISDSFTGIGKTYTLKVGGADTTGVDAGNGILFINGVFQTPSTENNAGNNYEIDNDSTVGVTSVIYTGITSVDGSFIQSDFDINQNQLPRGGLIVSLGSTPGLGYAPLVGAEIKVLKNSTGQLTDLIGINTVGSAVAISTALYNNITGILEIETDDSHNILGGDLVKLNNLEFSCASAHSGVTTTIFPDYDYPVDVINVISATKVAIRVGPSTIPHSYETGGTVRRFFTNNFGSGYREPVSIGITDLAYEHKFVRSSNNSITASTGGPFTPTKADFTSHTGVLRLTIPNHGLDTTDTIQIATDSLIFSCSDDDFFTEQPYPRATDPAAGATLAITSFTTNTISVGVGSAGGSGTGAVIDATVGIGGTLAFSITDPGQGYINPALIIPEPNYENVEVVGVSRLGIGATTETGRNLLLNLTVGAAGTSNVGIGSTLFLIDTFKIARSGYGFKPGDILEAVGLVTAKDFAQPVSPFQLEVVETFTDRFSSWSFGEMDYIDSIFGYQNGTRKRFPLFYEGELLSFELDPNNPLSANIDLDSVLVIFVNGVLQTPGYSYQFTGGTSFMFMEAPKVNDKVDIFFYLGQDGIDVIQVETTETLKVGDDVRMLRQPLISTTEKQINSRAITEITGSDIIETNIYSGPGVDDTNFRPFDWIKQKKDIYVKGDIISKVRSVLETKVFPTARIIGDVTPTSTDIFVDNAQFFDYDEIILDLNQNTFTFDAFMMETSNEPVSAEFTSTVSIAGTVSAITVDNVGLGYTTSTIDLKFSAPKEVGVGVGTTATATATISNGQVSVVTITNPGFGYTNTNPPKIITALPTPLYETINTVQNVQGFSGIITGISTTTGTGGHPLALKFNFRAMKDYGENGEANVASDALDLVAGYPIMIYETTVGNGVTSVNSDDSAVVGIGTTFLDNVYVVNSITSLASNAEIICNVDSGSPVIGILESGNFDDLQAGLTTSLGKLSWGRIYNYDNRTNGISIGVTGLTVDAGLSTFPTIQRRGNFGEGKTGAVRSKKPRADGTSLEADNTLSFYIQ